MQSVMSLMILSYPTFIMYSKHSHSQLWTDFTSSKSMICNDMKGTLLCRIQCKPVNNTHNCWFIVSAISEKHMRGARLCGVADCSSLLTWMSCSGSIAEQLRLGLKIGKRKTKGVDIVWNRLRSLWWCCVRVPIVSASVKTLLRVEVETKFDRIVDGFLNFRGKIGIMFIATEVIIEVKRIMAGFLHNQTRIRLFKSSILEKLNLKNQKSSCDEAVAA